MLNLLSPMLVQNTKELVFMDFTDNKVYKLEIINNSITLSEVENNLNNMCFEDVKNQQQALVPELPLDKIFEAFSVEKDLSEKNSNHSKKL